MDLPKARCPKKASAPFLWKKKQAFAPPSFRTNPKGRVAVVQMSPDWRDSVFGACSDRVGIRQNLDGSVSQRAFAQEGRGSTSTLRYVDAAVRRDEGKVVFYQVQK